MGAIELELPEVAPATEPPEERGSGRDDIRLLVATRHDGSIAHVRFGELPEQLRSGDLMVVNNSATLPAALPATRADGTNLKLHLSTPAPDRSTGGWWIVELRLDGRPFGRLRVGEQLSLPEGGTLEITARYATGGRLWLARLEVPGRLLSYLERHGRPIRYGYVPREWPLAAYQNAFALEPGSAEMPSAGRPFTPELVTRLVAGGVLVAPLTLHTGVSSPERNEPPYRERYRVPVDTARLVNAVRRWGGRVIAVGTTVVRALETVAKPGGAVAPGAGWTGLEVTRERGLRAVDGLLTGWHGPEASHLQLLEAALSPDLLLRSYAAAREHGYLWNEFGDTHLILP